MLSLIKLFDLSRITAEYHSFDFISIGGTWGLDRFNLLSQYGTFQGGTVLESGFQSRSSCLSIEDSSIGIVASLTWSGTSNGDSSLLISKYQNLIVRDVFDGLYFDVLFEFNYIFSIVIVHLLDFTHLLLMLVTWLWIRVVLNEVISFFTEIAHLLLEDLVHSLLIHFSLLLRCESYTSSEFLHVSFYALRYCLTWLLSEQGNHLPPSKALDRLFLEAQINQLILDLFLTELSQISISTRDSFRVLNGWIQVHPIYFRLV